MKTSELIAQALWEIEHYEDVVIMPTYIELISKFQMAYEDIEVNCSTCVNYPCNHRGDCFNNEYKGWQWRGDEE